MIVNPNRRQFAEAMTATGLSTWLGQRLSAATPTERATGAFKRCVALWMGGGPSQFETFDPKPSTAIGGSTKAVATSIPGVRFSQNLSSLASRADDLCLLRSIGSGQGEHERASHLLHTGFEEVASFPRPSLGAFVSSQSDSTDVPAFVTLGELVYGPAYLGAQRGPFVIDNMEQTRDTLQRVARHRTRLQLTSELNAYRSRSSTNHLSLERSAQIRSVERLLRSSMAEALDIEQESIQTRSRYGDSNFGRRVLAARRLLESGVSYVEVQMPGWDTHVNNFSTVTRLCNRLEPAWIALLDDLKSNGLWEDTLVLWMGGIWPHSEHQRSKWTRPFSTIHSCGLGGKEYRWARDWAYDTQWSTILRVE